MNSKSEPRQKRDESLRSNKDNLKSSTNGNLAEYPMNEQLKVQIDFYEQCLTEVFDRKRDFFIETIAERIKDSGVIGSDTKSSAIEHEVWMEIESLSKLRAIVGGRFQNIKQKWVDAGLPLREHRGDRAETFEINKEGWLELTHWINNQGFDTRLTTDKANCLFEIRARK